MTKVSTGFFDAVYDLADADAAKALYSEWATAYENTVISNGYATPTRCAKALAAAVTDRSLPLLDVGCGTGLSGVAFRACGFTIIDGTDFSAEMLRIARQKKGVYRKLTVGDFSQPLPADRGAYPLIGAVGVLSPKHGAADLIAQLVALLPIDGHVVFSLNDHTLENPAYRNAIDRMVGAGAVTLAHDEYGPHLPGQGIGAQIVVMRKQRA